MTPAPAPRDFSRWRSINLHSQAEVDYWALQLSCTQAELRDAMVRAGIMVVDVRIALQSIADGIDAPNSSRPGAEE